MGSLLEYFKPNPTTTYENALYFAGGIVLARLLQMISMTQYLYGSNHTGGKVRIAVCSVVYRKVRNFKNWNETIKYEAYYTDLPNQVSSKMHSVILLLAEKLMINF